MKKYFSIVQKDITIREFTGKSPMFFRDFGIAGSLYLVAAEKVKAWIPAEIKASGWGPLEVWPGKVAVTLMCMEYRNSDIGPYNEIILGVLIGPGGDLWKAMARGEATLFIKELPVSTQVAVYGGLDFFGFPKFLADISFRETSTHRICTLRDRVNHDLILEYEQRKIRKFANARTYTVQTVSVLNGQAVKGKLVFRPKNFGMSLLPWHGRLRTGERALVDAPAGSCLAHLKELGLGRPLLSCFTPSAEGALFEAEPI